MGKRCRWFYALIIQFISEKSVIFGIVWKPNTFHQAIYLTAHAKIILHSVISEQFFLPLRV
jgi:hypothetical protein